MSIFLVPDKPGLAPPRDMSIFRVREMSGLAPSTGHVHSSAGGVDMMAMCPMAAGRGAMSTRWLPACDSLALRKGHAPPWR
jgi:hypothetical protein